MRVFSKLLLSFILVVVFMRVYAYELEYSSWSETKPEDVLDLLIESEDRYLWYKEKEVNIEYLKRDEFGNKKYDLDNYKLSEESELLDEKPIENEDIIITEIETEGYYEDNEIKKARFNFNNGVYLSEIIVKDKYGNYIDYDIDPYYSILKDNKLDFIIYVKDLIITFDEKQDFNNINISFAFETNVDDNYLYFNYLTEDDNEMYEINLYINDSPVRIENLILDRVPYSVTKYTYKEKLYKTYEIEKEYTDDYYSNYDGYIKDNTTKKTFYRYITNDYIIVDDGDNIVKDPDNYCIKSFCSIMYLKEEVNEPEIEPIKEEEDIIINPQTIDNIYYYVILLIVSIIFSIFIYKDKIRKIYLVLSNRFKKI